MIDTDHIFIHLAKSTLTLTPFTYDGTLHNTPPCTVPYQDNPITLHTVDIH